MSSPPRYGTPRRPARRTTGPAVELLTRRFGYRFLPWQRHVADVAGELEGGVYAYNTVVVGVGRRAGKSLLTFAELMFAALGARGRRAWYTAQSRADAALTFRDEWAPIVKGSSLAPYISPRLANGSEAFTVPRHASGVRVFAPTPTALHGQAGDLIVFDEAWAHSAERGAELMIAARPLMATRPGAQLWILSAAGDIDSTWWAEWLELGRAAAELDTGTGVAYFEWSADVEGLDLTDPAVWAGSHPAVARPDNPTGTITLDWLAAEHALDPGAFRRTYLNVCDRTGVTSSPLDPVTWAARAVADWDRGGALVAGVDCAPEQAATAVVVAGELDGGAMVVELVEHRPGIGWAAERIAELVDTWSLEAVALDRAGPAGALWAELEAAGVPVREMGLRDVAAAAATFVEAVRTDRVAHRPALELDQAVAAARRRPTGDGAWTFSRTGSSADVSPLIAATLARAVHPAVGAPAPAVHG